jgi:hypothetical protein
MILSMNLLECLIGIALCALLINPLLKTSADLLIKQIAYEKSQALVSEAERALELMGRAIRMAGYKKVQSEKEVLNKKNTLPSIEILKRTGYQGSDALITRHELSNGVDYDCIGNALTMDRTKQGRALQGFLVDRQAALPKGVKASGGSLMCQSLDRHGRIQNTTLMNGVNLLKVEELGTPVDQGQKSLRVRLEMADGVSIEKEFERIFTTRNLP